MHFVETHGTGTVIGDAVEIAALNDVLGEGRPMERALRVSSVKGNIGHAESLTFRVVAGDAATLPFERTQVVWVRFDLDRDGNQTPDFEDDLLKLGLISEGNPAGTNQRMIAIMRDGILTQTHRIFERKDNGGRSGPDSIPVLFTATRPRGVAYTSSSG